MSTLSTHVLDTASGRPAAGVEVTLQSRAGDGWTTIHSGTTNDDGRVSDLLPTHVSLSPGVYRLNFNVGAWQRGHGSLSFYPWIPVVFEIHEPAQHYHVPLLLSPFAYSTYRGS